MKLNNISNTILQKNNNKILKIIFQSFGFKYKIPSYTNYLFDVRFLPNPYWKKKLKKLNGLNKKVIKFIEKQKKFNIFIEKTKKYINYLINISKKNKCELIIISFGCTGGQHRSVYIVEKLYNIFKVKGYNIITIHNSLLNKKII
ncbi:RNase adapter RapZ [Candidatus Purcelliella pentastirinorum]|nr:RNase adapter RapZ [Candidatus Purcelliella pentastirinorum]WDI78958.1 RNase adapter RapZ [Candidatus Purcelliella pentastirinorum]WDR80094.1 RNase adapter RapZ [Candidatus Purcelliella pentastirinorum]